MSEVNWAQQQGVAYGFGSYGYSRDIGFGYGDEYYWLRAYEQSTDFYFTYVQPFVIIDSLELLLLVVGEAHAHDK